MWNATPEIQKFPHNWLKPKQSQEVNFTLYPKPSEPLWCHLTQSTLGSVGNFCYLCIFDASDCIKIRQGKKHAWFCVFLHYVDVLQVLFPELIQLLCNICVLLLQ